MQLSLVRPLVFFDLETTGLKIGVDRIVEISLLKALPNGDIKQITQLINPEMPIPKVSTDIHGITDNDVVNAPTFKAFANKLNDFLIDCDFAGYNSNYFDIPVLVEEFLRVGVDFEIKGRKFIDVQSIFHQNEPRDLKAAYKFYCEKELIGHHGAEADIKATYEILLSQLQRYPHIQNDVAFLHRYTSRNNRSVDLAGRIVLNDQDIEVFNFGKHKGVPVKEVLKKEPGYYDWMMKGEFPNYTKKVLTGIKLSLRNEQQ